MRHIKKICLMLLFVASAGFCGDWVMFSDGKDTYIYNTQSGEIYIRFKKGGANYEDIFVKMPIGKQPNEVSKKTQSSTSQLQDSKNTEAIRKMQLDALQKSQEILSGGLD